MANMPLPCHQHPLPPSPNAKQIVDCCMQTGSYFVSTMELETAHTLEWSVCTLFSSKCRSFNTDVNMYFFLSSTMCFGSCGGREVSESC